MSGVIDNNRRVLHKDAGVLGALDLGGSSTQVSLYTSSAGTTMVNQGDFFVHSYLGFGVEKMAERYTTYLQSAELKQDPCSPKGYKNPSSGLIGSGDYAKCKDILTAALGLECGGSARCIMDGTELPAASPNSKFIGMSVYFFAIRSLLLSLAKADLPASLSWPSPTLDEMAQAGTSFCGLEWSKLEAVANMDGWEPFTGDANQRKSELPQRCIQTAFIDVLLGKVYGIPRDKRNVMVCMLCVVAFWCSCILVSLYQIALDIDKMEVEWTLGSVIASAGEEIEIIDDTIESVSFDTRLVSLCVFLTLAVAFFVFRSACVGSRKGSSRQGSRASTGWSSFLTASFTSKAAFLS